MGWDINAEIITTALTQIKNTTGLMGRWEIIQSSPNIVLDVAHNEHGITALLEQLATTTYQQLHIVTGMVKDKDVDAVLSMLPKNANYYFTQSHIPRALAAQELVLKATAAGLIGEAYEDVNAALVQAKQNSQTNDLILVIGSVYLVAEVNRKLFI
jgi:dihydrofolate synthase/folylpolyglutamate synthase